MQKTDEESITLNTNRRTVLLSSASLLTVCTIPSITIAGEGGRDDDDEGSARRGKKGRRKKRKNRKARAKDKDEKGNFLKKIFKKSE